MFSVLFFYFIRKMIRENGESKTTLDGHGWEKLVLEFQ